MYRYNTLFFLDTFLYGIFISNSFCMPGTGELWLCNKQKLFHSAASSILLHGIKLSQDQRYLQIYIQHILHLSDTFFLLLIQNVQKKKSDKKKKRI